MKRAFVGALEHELSEFCREFEEGGAVMLGDWVILVEYLDGKGAVKEITLTREGRRERAYALMRRMARRVAR